jgi:RNA polymerase sigma-70 factor (ECF subfamily)
MLRTVMNLNAVESYTYPEISELLDIPEGTIRTYIFRARKILTEHFKIKNV